MAAVLEWAGDDDEAPALSSITSRLQPPAGRGSRPGELPAAVRAALWRGSELGLPVQRTLGSGFAALDAELPGGGWPCHALTELLQPQAAVAEWRLLAPAMRAGRGQRARRGRRRPAEAPASARAAPCGPRRTPAGLDPGRGALGAAVGHRAARQGELRRTARYMAAAGTSGADPSAAGVRAGLRRARCSCAARWQRAHETSAAPLRCEARFGVDWELHLRLLKRRGPTHEGVLRCLRFPAASKTS